jgi:hypothetical protein
MKNILIILLIAFFWGCSSKKDIKLPEAPKQIIVNCDPVIDGLEQGVKVINQKCTFKIIKNTDDFSANYKLETKVEIAINEHFEITPDELKSSYLEIHFFNKNNSEVCTFLMVRATDLSNLSNISNESNTISFKGEMPIIIDHNDQAQTEATEFINDLKSVTFMQIKFIKPEQSSSGETCEEFEEYKEAVEEYLDVLQEMKNDPTNVENSSKVTGIAQKVTDKALNLSNCVNYNDLNDEISELQEKMRNLK